MSLLKYIARLERMDDLIKNGRTGNAKCFAGKLGLSVSQMKEEIRELRSLGAKIRYDRFRRSYVYQEDCSLVISFT